jgi:hypothetical protein
VPKHVLFEKEKNQYRTDSSQPKMPEPESPSTGRFRSGSVKEGFLPSSSCNWKETLCGNTEYVESQATFVS